jgi:tripartite-type tricarboxylate transporter receptor subunit TctC
MYCLHRLALAALAALAAATLPAAAQSYSRRPVTIIVPMRRAAAPTPARA